MVRARDLGMLKAKLMRLRFLHRLGLALWLGLIALTASGVAQNQLSLDVISATLNDHQHPPGSGHHGHGHQSHEHQSGGHFMPDGTYMAGPMSGDMSGHGHHGHATDAAQNGGHTHKGHADCNMCGLVATMAALTVPLLIGFMSPESFATPLSWSYEHSVFIKASYAPYASRAPPHITG